MRANYLLVCLLTALVSYISLQKSFCSQRFTSSNNTVNAGDYPTIQKAVEALSEDGGTVIIPTGTYKISEPIIVNKSDVTLTGTGSGTVLLNTSESGGNTIELSGEKENPIWRVKVSNMHLKGNEKCGNAIYAKRVYEISLSGMWIDYHGKSGIYLDYCYENPRVYDNNIAYNKEMGVLIDGSHDIVVSANQFEENGIGIYGKDLFNATVTGNNIDDHIMYSIQFENACGSIITGNMLEESVEECVVLNKSDGIVVTGNTFRNAGKKLLHIINTHGVTVSGNAFDGSYGNTIDIENNSKTITISGNVITSHPAWGRIYGIIMKDVYDVSITGNTIVNPLEGGIYILGNENKYINITGNTIKNPSGKSPEKHSGILIHNTLHCIISNNMVVDDGETKIMKSAIEETGNSDNNVIMNNYVNKGTLGHIISKGKNTKVKENIIY